MTDTNRPIDPADIALTSFSFTQIGKELREGDTYTSVGKNSRSLVKSPEFSMVLMALNKGGELKEHHAPAPATAVVLEGRIILTAQGKEQALEKHESVVFSPELQHGVKAREESLLLLIIGGKPSRG